MASSNDDIILDFFSGSATTAHAVLDLNRVDGGNRKFFLVQMPEETDANSEAYKTGYRTIAEIGKERIRRVIKKLKDENPDKAKDQDLGFKVFKLSQSHYKPWRNFYRAYPRRIGMRLCLSRSGPERGDLRPGTEAGSGVP